MSDFLGCSNKIKFQKIIEREITVHCNACGKWNGNKIYYKSLRKV